MKTGNLWDDFTWTVATDGYYWHETSAGLLLRPAQAGGKTLRLNAKSDFGEITVELLDGEGKVLAQSKSIQRDALNIPVEWKKEAPKIQDAPVTLRIKLQNARLFALWCE